MHFEPEHEAVTFDDNGTPLLIYGRHPIHGMGWTLCYLEVESDTGGVDDYFIPGDIGDLDDVVEEARRWLAMCAHCRAAEERT